MKKIVGRAIVLVVLATTAVILGFSFWPVMRTAWLRVMPPTNPSRPPVVGLATSKNLWCALSLIALEEGFFRDAGLEVKPHYQVAGRYNMDALLAKSVEFANVVEVNLAYQALSGNRNLHVPASIVTARDFAIVTRKSRGIAGIGDLRGRTLAFSPGTGAEMYVLSLMKKYDFEQGSVEFKRIQPSAIVDLVFAGGADAAASWEPFVSTMKARLGVEAVEFYDPNVFAGVMDVAIRADWGAKNRDDVRRFLDGLQRAEHYVHTEVGASQEILARITGMHLDTVKEIWPRFTFEVSLDQHSQEQVTRSVMELVVASEEAYEGGTIPDVASYFEGGYLDAPLVQ